MPERTFLPKAPVTDEKHAETLLELAFLMASADGRLADEELAAFRKLIAVVRGRAPSDAEIGDLVQRFSSHVEQTAIPERVRQLAPTLPPSLREDAFRIGMGLALVDRDADDDEDALMGVLYESLGLDEARAEEIAGEIRRAFG